MFIGYHLFTVSDCFYWYYVKNCRLFLSKVNEKQLPQNVHLVRAMIEFAQRVEVEPDDRRS